MQVSLFSVSKDSNLEPSKTADLKPSTSKAGLVLERLGRKRASAQAHSDILRRITEDAEKETVRKVAEPKSSVAVKTSCRVSVKNDGKKNSNNFF